MLGMGVDITERVSLNNRLEELEPIPPSPQPHHAA